MPDAYSIRESLQGALADFVRDSGFNCVKTEGIVRELVGLLASYREEDLLLFPEVFVVSHLDGLKAIAPSGERVFLGTTDLKNDAAEVSLKRCAALAHSGWAMFLIKESETHVRFGVFRSLRHSFATGAEESMGDLGGSVPMLLIRNRGHLVVELRNSTNRTFTATLRTVAASPSTLLNQVDDFVVAAASSVPNSEPFKPYLRRLLMDQLQRCHGILMAVGDPVAMNSLPHETLSDGVWLQPPLDLGARHAAAIKRQDADGLADLQAAETMLSGMMNSDGIVLMGTDGTIMAFGVFLTANVNERNELPTRGGGRRRTFELMRLRLNAIFHAVLFRSQDGETDCRRRAT